LTLSLLLAAVVVELKAAEETLEAQAEAQATHLTYQTTLTATLELP
jgi:hypothetical protein